MVAGIAGSVLLQQKAMGQCVPDGNFTGLYSPEFNVGLPDASTNLAYTTTIHVRVPLDTTIFSLTVTVDSLILKDIIGLPEGLSYSCQNATCVTMAGDLGCVEIAGTITDETEIGTHDLTIKFTLYNSLLAYNYDLTEYSIDVVQGAPNAVWEQKHTAAPAILLEHNPVRPSSHLSFQLPESGPYSIQIHSLLGSEVARINDSGHKGLNKQVIGSLTPQPGVYFVTVHQGAYSMSLRYVVQ